MKCLIRNTLLSEQHQKNKGSPKKKPAAAKLVFILPLVSTPLNELDSVYDRNLFGSLL
jgi:hypothetical protein